MASILKVDELQGITAAGDITVTSEGGAATQSLQQGLVKVWFLYDGSGTPAFLDSFNTSSLTDHATGDHSVNFTNAMSNANHSLGGAVGNNNNGDLATSNLRRGVSATTASRNTIGYPSALFDYNRIGGNICGDLA